MSTALPPEWYLEIEGRKSGPYTADQIEGFLKDREILPRHRVFSPRRPDQLMTAGEFVSAIQHQRQMSAGGATATPPSKPRAFQPPNKPQDMDERTGIIKVDTAARADPTQHLFDALQAVRERQTQAKLNPPADLEWGSLARTTPARRSQLLLTATLTSLLAVSVWGLNRLLQRGPASIERPEKMADGTKDQPTSAPKPGEGIHGNPTQFSPGTGGTAPASMDSAKAHTDPKALAVQTPPKSITTINRLVPNKAQPVAIPANLERARDRTENHEEDREAKGEARKVDRDPVEEYERQQRGESNGDGALAPLSPGEAGVGGDPQQQGDAQQIDPKEIPIE